MNSLLRLLKHTVFFLTVGSILPSASANIDLRMNHIQAKGTHNSYHLKSISRWLLPSHSYSQKNLDVQLNSGVRQIEIDIHLHTSNEIQVHHIKYIDDKSNCNTLTSCLEIIKDWSVKNPTHSPIIIWIELKDHDLDMLLSSYKIFLPDLRLVTKDILSVFSLSEIITPDMLRGSYETLPEAIENKGWPTIDSTRGKVLFSLLNDRAGRKSYVKNAPNLKNKLMFVRSDNEDQPFAATFKIDNPVSSLAHD